MRSTDYAECKTRLDDLKQNWDTHPENYKQLDSNWVCVKFPKSMWRLAKSVGAKKDGYWGWILWSGSKDNNGTNFSIEVAKIAWEYEGLLVRERQL